jgi:ubiquinone/menaquinone biosynthesis C-methylase UbiE
MFWDKVASVYDFFENVYNGKVYKGTGQKVAEEIVKDDEVLECACGTGAISVYIAPKCAHLVATDMSKNMLKQTDKKTRDYGNVETRIVDMRHLDYADDSFNKVVAGNVIHLLDDPKAAVAELIRVCKPGGKVIIPTYINIYSGKLSVLARLLGKAGANFKRQFDLESYKKFFRKTGYNDVSFHVVEGRMPCAIAVIKK